MIICHLSRESNPYYHLALETAIFENSDIEQAFIVYRNVDTVSLGRFQNPWQETHPRLLRENGIFLSRRFSGGGTVFQDEGNINFSFIGKNDTDTISKHFALIQRTLSDWGIVTEISEKRDMLWNGKKFSGSAFYLKSGRLLHHGTLLVHSDLRRLGEFLKGALPDIQSMGTASRRAKVCNLTEAAPALTLGKLFDALIEHFQKENPHFVISEASQLQKFLDIEKISHYSSFRWLLGETPRFQWQGENFIPRKWNSLADLPEPFHNLL
jgi:lipoate---protein ligase